MALTAGHARSLIAADNPTQLADQIIRLGLSVRDAERLTRESPEAASGRQPKISKKKDADLRAVEQSLAEATGLKIEISDKGHKGGRVIIEYKSLDQLDEICRKLRLRN